MEHFKKVLHGRTPYYVLLSLCAVLLLATGADVLWKNQEKSGLKATIQGYFSAQTQEEKQIAWQELVEIGAADFHLVLWGLENTHSILMFEKGKLEQLFDDIEFVNGGPVYMVESCSQALDRGELTAGKALAMDILLENKSEILPGDIQNMRSILMNTEELPFVRMKAGKVLSKLNPEGLADDFVTLISHLTEPEGDPEPVALREVCLVCLSRVSKEKAKNQYQSILEDPEAPFRLVKRAIDCACQSEQTQVLISALGKETDTERRAELAKALTKTGDTNSLNAVKNLTDSQPEDKVIEAVLDGVAAGKAAGFESLISQSLNSNSKALRLKALRAANQVQISPVIEDKINELSISGSPEEQYFIDLSREEVVQ